MSVNVLPSQAYWIGKRSSWKASFPEACTSVHGITIASLLGFEISELPFTATFLPRLIFHMFHFSQCPQLQSLPKFL